MFRFEDVHIFWFLAVLPICLVYLFWLFKNRTSRIGTNGDVHIIQRLISSWSPRRYWLKNIFFLLAIAMLLTSWANPQWGMRKEKTKVKSSDIVIALDISQSMLAEDISPNRMERSKFFVSELIKKLRGDRIGLIFFAGSAYLQMPLTNDYASAQTFVQSANPRQAGTQGTVIADAIKLSEKVFGEESKGQKALVIISDGENHESEAIEAARDAREKGITVFTLGIGTESGAMIPVTVNGRKVFKTDQNGNAIRSALNSDNLVDIADAGSGEFYMIDQSLSALPELDARLEKLEKRELEQRSFTDYNSYFQLFLILALVLLLLEYILGDTSNSGKALKKILDI